MISDTDLRDLALAVLPAAAEPEPEAISGILDQNVGAQIAALNQEISGRARGRRVIERVGPSHDHYRASVITVLRGGAGDLAPRLALTAAGAGDCEFIMVLNGPEGFDALVRAAHTAYATLGVPVTLVWSPDGEASWFGEEVASDIARSDRLIFMDPAVFPRDPDWAAAHDALLTTRPAAETRLMGGLLFEAGGTMTDGGHYIDEDVIWGLGKDGTPRRTARPVMRKFSSPPRSGPWAARGVVALPAAFLSIDRGWLETLGGFSRSYAGAALDDLDLCLRAQKAGSPPWVHDLPMWHFERHGPARPAATQGGAIFNEWLLTRRWGDMLNSGRLGLESAA